MPSKTIRPWARQARPPQQSRAVHAGSGRHRGVLAGLHVLVTGTDASPHLTGFAGFSTAVTELITSRRGLVAQLKPTTDDPKSFASQPDPIDLVIAVAPGPGVAAAASLADRHDVPLLVLTQATSLPARALGGTVGEMLAAKLDRALAARADRWAATCQAAHDQLVGGGVPAGQIDRLPYWSEALDTPDPNSHPAERISARTTVRENLGWPVDTFLIACPVGADLSDVPLLLAAAEELANRNSPARLIITGRGGRLRQLRENAGPAATSVFEVTGSQYPATFVAADMALLATADAALAGRVASALAAGTPIVTITGTGAGTGTGTGTGAQDVVPELAAVEDACLQVRAATPQQLADAIETLAEASQARALLAAAARGHARQLLDPGSAADTLEAVITATLAARAR